MEHINIKGIIFDYGGTIDSKGEHWSEVIWRGYNKNSIAITKDQFRNAYVYAERELARVKHILPEHNFYDLLLIKMRIELQWLSDNNYLEKDAQAKYAEKIAEYCYLSAKECVEHAKPVLDKLACKYPMVLVSNFYGNVESVLSDFGLTKYFKTIIESAVVGVRKPDPKIFSLGIDALGLEAKDVLVVGDSYKKDILPAESLGCNVLWLKGKGWTDDEDLQNHKNIIKDLSEIVDVAF